MIPKNIMKLNELNKVDIVSIFTLNTKGSLSNKKMMFIKGFGILQSLKMGLAIGWAKLLDKIDLLFGFGFLKNPRSLVAASNRSNAMHEIIDNPNSPKFLSELEKQDIDIIISFSAPSVFNNNLLNIPKYGCINLHCSLLPKYAGLFPSFWTVFKEEKEIGATVHYMDDKIDNGEILGQIKFPMPENPTIFRVIQATKNAGGNLMCEVINDLLDGSLESKANHEIPKNYFSWPSIDQINEFRKQGGRLI